MCLPLGADRRYGEVSGLFGGSGKPSNEFNGELDECAPNGNRGQPFCRPVNY